MQHDNNNQDDDTNDIEYVSKSELKREMHALQAMGERIVKMKAGELAIIPLEGDLEEAILTARRIKSREGLRRQMQYIGKLLRQIDTTEIEAAFTELENGRKHKAAKLKNIEAQRDQLITDGVKGVESILAVYPTADRQHLRQLVLQANKEKQNNKPPSAARKIYQYLRDIEK